MGIQDLINGIDFDELEQERRTKERRRSDREMARFVERQERGAKIRNIVWKSDAYVRGLEYQAVRELQKEEAQQAEREERTRQLVELLVLAGLFMLLILAVGLAWVLL